MTGILGASGEKVENTTSHNLITEEHHDYGICHEECSLDSAPALVSILHKVRSKEG
jgi:hypothetical protein